MYDYSSTQLAQLDTLSSRQSLSHFVEGSRIVEQTLFYLKISSLKSEMFVIDDLPAELLVAIIAHLPIVDIARFRRCSSHMHRLVITNSYRLPQTPIRLQIDGSTISWRRCEYVSGQLFSFGEEVVVRRGWRQRHDDTLIDYLRRRQLQVQSLVIGIVNGTGPMFHPQHRPNCCSIIRHNHITRRPTSTRL